MRNLSLLPLPLALIAAPVLATDEAETQATPPATQDAEPVDTERHGNEILVVAERIRGQVESPSPPIAVLDEKDIQALGATTLADVLTQLAPQTGSGRGRGGGQPVVLINGQRIGSFREMRNFPQEAIRRVEILPEEVALRFGFPANTRVVNMILKDNFSSKTVEVEAATPTRGGFQTYEVEATALRIDGPQRFSLTAKIDDTSELTEAERGVIQTLGSVPTVSTDPDPAAFRTLIANSRELGLNVSLARGLGKDGLGGNFSVNGNLTRTDSRRNSGLDVVVLTAPGGATAIRSLDDPLERRTRTTTAQGGTALNTRLGEWQLSATLDGNHSESRTLIDRRANTAALVTAAAAGTLPINGPLPAVANAGFDTSLSNTESLTSLVTLIGRPARLPGGELTTTLRAGYAWSDIVSSDTRSTVGLVNLRRGDINAAINAGVPITSRRENFGAGLGDLSANFSAGWNRLSDFGSVTDWSAGLTWSPLTFEKLSLTASYLVNEIAPGLAQLGNPRTVTLNVPVFDLVRGETVLATVIGGGNPALLKEQQRDLKFGANWQLPFLANSSLVMEYFRNRSENVTASFPLLTPEIEAAFPGRVTRDGGGRLLSIDQRPVTFSEQRASRLRWGLNLTGQLGKAPAGGGFMGMMGGGGPPRGAGGPPAGPRPQGGGAGRGGGGGGMMAMMGGGRGPGRWSLGVFHTVQFDSTVLIAPGVPTLDLLNGDSLSSTGSPRHTLEFNGGLFKNGFGTFFNGTWTGPSRLTGTTNLRFGSVTRMNINFFASLGQQQGLVKQAPFFKGSQVSLRFENLFDSRQRVTDGTGAVPIGYQADLIDPRGRVVEIEFRKMF
ncbi:MAG: TonB-dependent receptor [Sphingomonadaceae bacterium]|nr:TonB-dependent receptor [Sphingomonadaceae bacterium]